LGTLWDPKECNQFCSKEELWEAARYEEMKIPWQEANEGPPVPEEQYQERFWRRRLDGIGLDTATKEFLAIEFKRTQDARSNYVERATAVAQKQYKSLLTGVQAVCQVVVVSERRNKRHHHHQRVEGTTVSELSQAQVDR
jgi:hypothetical protein